MKKPRCHVCNSRDCPGWQVGEPEHEYRNGSWTLGCHCSGCSKARDESGGFMGLIAELYRRPRPTPPQENDR